MLTYPFAVGAIFTAAVAAMILADIPLDSLGGLVSGLFSAENMLHLGGQFLFGTIWTLTLLPAITPWWSRKLGIVK